MAMKVPQFVLEILREIGQEMLSHPEKFSGGFRVNSLQGGITHFNVEISYRRPTNGQECKVVSK